MAYATLLMSAVGNFFPIFKGGNTLPSIIVASILLWGVHYLILKGVETAAFINSIVTVAKLIPILLVIVCMIGAFNFETFKAGLYGMTSGDTGIFSWGDIRPSEKYNACNGLGIYRYLRCGCLFKPC